MTDRISKAKRRKIMRRIKSRGTKPEKDFAYRYPGAILHPDWLPYHPDFLVAGMPIFLDSSFWHCRISRERYAKLPKYWQDKLFKNVVRDQCAIKFYNELPVETWRFRV